MAKTPDDRRLELLQGTLDMLILRTLQWGPQHGHGIGQAIRTQSDDLLKVETGSLYPALHRRKARMAEVRVGGERGQPAREVLPADRHGKGSVDT
jgi:DNA-binding PadR family transcriptional regulator